MSLMITEKTTSNWKMTRICAIGWWIIFVLTMLVASLEAAALLFFTAAGWTGWALEEWKNHILLTQEKNK